MNFKDTFGNLSWTPRYFYSVLVILNKLLLLLLYIHLFHQSLKCIFFKQSFNTSNILSIGMLGNKQPNTHHPSLQNLETSPGNPKNFLYLMI